MNQIALAALLLASSLAYADPAAEVARHGQTLAGLDRARAIYEDVPAPSMRLEHAFGLVLLKNTKRTEGVKHLLRCRGDASYPAGWFAAMRVLVDEEKYADVFADFPKLAGAVASHGDTAEAELLAEQLGRLLCAIDVVTENPDAEAVWLEAVQSFKPSQQRAFDRGYEMTTARAETIAERRRQREEAKAKAAADKLQQERTRLDELREKTIEEEFELLTTADDWRLFLEERQKDAEEKLSEYSKELEEVVEHQQRRAVEIARLRRSLAIISDIASGPLKFSDEEYRERREIVLVSARAALSAREVDLEDDSIKAFQIRQDAAKVIDEHVATVERAKRVLGSAARRFESLGENDRVARLKLAKLKEDPENPIKKLNSKPSVRMLFPWDTSAEVVQFAKAADQ